MAHADPSRPRTRLTGFSMFVAAVFAAHASGKGASKELAFVAVLFALLAGLIWIAPKWLLIAMLAACWAMASGALYAAAQHRCTPNSAGND